MGNAIESSVVKKHIETDAYTKNHYEFKWTIPDISSCPTKPIHSGTIQLDEEKWDIAVYPHGFNERVNDYISLWLKKHSEVERRVRFSCTIFNCRRKVFLNKTKELTMALESAIGWATFCRRSFILQKENNVLTDGSLVLEFTLEVFADKEIANAVVEDDDPGMENQSLAVCRRMSKLLAQGTFSDVTIFVALENFRLHKSILCASSSVFHAMFHSDLEKNSRRIFIKDVSAAAFKEMTRFIYSGELGDIDLDIASELFYAADKYCIESLGAICSKVLHRNLDLNNAIQILLLADRHNDLGLKEKSIAFIADNALEIQASNDWLQLMKTHPHLVNNVLNNVAKRLKRTKEK